MSEKSYEDRERERFVEGLLLVPGLRRPGLVEIYWDERGRAFKSVCVMCGSLNTCWETIFDSNGCGSCRGTGRRP